eukprot:TRINITY_DN11511_c0_g1_i2.p1 TRINITY_DN11511_c0_g1~~TRINITY_DN11511_c0_g1_i2.p1  ORF type:complete len:646 (+),score=153.14 TRINITY_DN11511_c0_g1_i2:35-1972(+)
MLCVFFRKPVHQCRRICHQGSLGHLLLQQLRGVSADMLHHVTITIPKDMKSEVLLGASRGNDLKILEALLSTGADPNSLNITSTGDMSDAPLHTAARKGHLEICEALVRYGANPNISTLSDETPLMLAASAGHRDISTFLIKHGALKSMTDLEGVGAQIQNYGEDGYVWSNVNTFDAISQMDHEKRLKLMTDATTRNYADELEILLSLGTDPNTVVPSSAISPGKFGTPLHIAASYGHYESCNVLLRYGADAHVLTDSGASVFCIAVSKPGVRFFKIAKALVERGALRSDPTLVIHKNLLRPLATLPVTQRATATLQNLPVERKAAFFTNAVDLNIIPEAKELLARGVDPTVAAQCFQKTVFEGRVGMCRVFLEQGADANGRADDGRKLLTIALKLKSRRAVAAALMEYGAVQEDIPDKKIAVAGEPKSLLWHGPIPDRLLQCGSLRVAAKKGHAEPTFEADPDPKCTPRTIPPWKAARFYKKEQKLYLKSWQRERRKKAEKKKKAVRYAEAEWKRRNKKVLLRRETRKKNTRELTDHLRQSAKKVMAKIRSKKRKSCAQQKQAAARKKEIRELRKKTKKEKENALRAEQKRQARKASKQAREKEREKAKERERKKKERRKEARSIEKSSLLIVFFFFSSMFLCP